MKFKILKIFRIVVSVIFLLALFIYCYTILYSALTHNAFRTRVEISQNEKDFIKKVQDECECELKYSYDILAEDPNFFKENKKFFLELWSYDEYNNWCMQDSSFIQKKASTLIKDFISVSEYSHMFEDISLVFIVYQDVGKKEKLIQTICKKSVEYNIQKDKIKYIE